MKPFLALLTGIIIVPAQAHANCTPVLDVPPQVQLKGDDSRGYDGFAQANYATTFQIAVSNRDSATECSYLLSIQHPGSAQALDGDGGGALSYEISQNGNHADVVDQDTIQSRPPSAIQLLLKGGGRWSRTFRAFIPPNQISTSGNYGETIVVRLMDPLTYDIVAERSFELQTKVEQRVSIFLGHGALNPQAPLDNIGARRGRIDFGIIEPNEMETLGLTILSNDSYSVVVESENRGRLAHKVYGDDSVIDYVAFLGNRRLNLTSGPDIGRGYPMTSRSGSSTALTFKISDFGAVQAGNYSDRVTLTVLSDN